MPKSKIRGWLDDSKVLFKSTYELTVQPFPHQPPGPELDPSLSRNIDSFQGLWVVRLPWCSDPSLKYAEVPELQTVALDKLFGDSIENLLDDGLHRSLPGPGLFCDVFDEFLFCYC